jgi:hypothetical protein
MAASRPAWASGDPRAIFVGLAPLLLLAGMMAWILVAKAGWSRKWRALLAIALALVAEIGLWFVPGYDRNAWWIVPATFAAACAGAVLAWRSLPRGTRAG